ncbi:MAG TPA: PDZ domain-containing protein [Thermoanaerobaculia bacterium]|nr:PDZ domain-containing protein [Thermoanaerobaculia bacterium]
MIKPSRIVIAGTAAASLLWLLAATGRAQAAGGPGSDRPEGERHKLIVINENGEEKVFEGEGPTVKRGYLGVELTELTPELRAHFGAPESAGVMIARVDQGSPAEKAGLKVGDILTALDGKPVGSSWDVRSRVRKLGDGTSLPLEVRRDGSTQTLTATVEQRQRPEIDLAPLLMKRGEGDGMKILHLPMHGSPEDGEAMVLPRVRIQSSAREAELEKKLKALEKRLAELESRLPKD